MQNTKGSYNKVRPLIKIYINTEPLTIQKRQVKSSIFFKPAVKRQNQRVPMVNRPVIPYEDLPVKVRLIMSAVCHHYGVRPEDILVKSRKKEVVEPRHMAMYFCAEYVMPSPSVIGRWFNRDHSSVLTALANVKNHHSLEKRYKKRFDQAHESIKIVLNEINLLDNQ